jgi:aminoglycoside 6'-N-acetyltransferase I
VAIFVADRGDERLGGFIEAGLRPFADGCETRPVGYVEGWYVDADLRRQGLGAALLGAAEAWARSQGCAEMASDCRIDNAASLSAHVALGYVEDGRSIHLAKKLR